MREATPQPLCWRCERHVVLFGGRRLALTGPPVIVVSVSPRAGMSGLNGTFDAWGLRLRVEAERRARGRP